MVLRGYGQKLLCKNSILIHKPFTLKVFFVTKAKTTMTAFRTKLQRFFVFIKTFVRLPHNAL